MNPALNADEQFEYYSIPAYQVDQRPTLARGREIGSSKLLLQSGTILFGKLNPRVEKVWRVGNYTELRKIGSTEWLPLIPRDDVDEHFLYFLMWSEHVMPKAKALVSGSTPSRQRVDPRSFYRIEAPLPLLPEQRKIASVLGLVQRAIEQQERLLTLTAELKKALLHQLFTHGLRHEPQKQTEIGSVPEGWEQRALEDTGDVVYGIQAAVAANLKPVGTKILTNKNISLDGQILLDSVNYFVLKTKRHHDTLLKRGDLLFNWRSGSKEHVGKTAYFNLDGEFTHSSFILRIRPHDEVTGRFLFYYLNFLRESGYFVKSQTFSVNAKFNKSAINRLPTYLPREDERREIVTALDAVAKKIEVAQTKKRLLFDLFRTLLHELMTARIRVHNLDLPELERAIANKE
jgi:type I restriction enzyme, S subunit